MNSSATFLWTQPSTQLVHAHAQGFLVEEAATRSKTPRKPSNNFRKQEGASPPNPFSEGESPNFKAKSPSFSSKKLWLSYLYSLSLKEMPFPSFLHFT